MGRLSGKCRMDRRAFLAGAVGGVAAPLVGCARPAAIDALAGSGISLSPLRTYSQLESRGLLRLAGVAGVPVHADIDCYRVLYPSRGSAGQPITLSGLLALPRGSRPRGLVSWQHGTTTTRAATPSNLSVDGLAAAIVFAANGFALIAPDYIGLGVSKLTHTYLVADDTARAVIDLLTAARSLPGVPATPPFLIGFSQGGHATLAVQNLLEASGRPILGSAAIAGPHNLRTISLGAALAGGSTSHPLFLAYMVRGYAARYGHTIDSVLAPPAAALTPQLFDSPHEPDAIIAALPKRPPAMFRADFLDAFDTGGRHWLLDAIAANEVSHFRPQAPVRLYFGNRDVDVPPAEATTTERMLRQTGGQAQAIDVGPYDHNGSILVAAPKALAWLETLTLTKL